MTKLTDAQLRALENVKAKPMGRGYFSGWSRDQSSFGRTEITDATANRLISLGMIERTDIDGDPTASTVSITDVGRAALRYPTPESVIASILAGDRRPNQSHREKAQKIADALRSEGWRILR